MAQGTRQNTLFAAEDFTVVYESFANSNFKAYDFDTIREAMINYVQNTYPEEYNDWIQSSEFVALMDLVSYFGHNLAFRLDYATRENFFGTAQRRESLIRQSNLINYRVRRNLPAFGYGKIIDIQTNEVVYDINGNNLQNKKVSFENSAEYENFITVINAVLQSSTPFGSPSSSKTLDGELFDFYRLNTTAGQAVFKFSATANGQSDNFEFVGLSYDDTTDTIRESVPNPASGTDIIYQNKNTGIAGNDTGFFMGLKQGTLAFEDYAITSPVINKIIDINSSNVNDTDVWVQNINNTGAVAQNWTNVSSLSGSNVIYNSLTSTNRFIHSTESRSENAVSIKFSDGNFGEIPSGTVRVWFRTSRNETYTLRPVDVGKQTITMSYTGSDGNNYTATLGIQLKSNVNTASSGETNADIRLNAPQTYSSQDRMVSAEDYTVYPYNVSSNIKKIKALNRTHSGHSRFVDNIDPTGNYQDVTHFGSDGIIYNEGKQKSTELALPSSLSNLGVIEKYIEPYINDAEVINFYYTKFGPKTFNYTKATTSNGTNAFKWQKQSGSTGYLISGVANNVQRVGTSASGNLRYFKTGSLCEFIVDTSSTKNYVDGEVSSISVVNQGSGYSTVTVDIIGAGTGATATATVNAGAITGINVTAAGSGYDEFTVAQITDSGAGAGCSVKVNVGSLETIWARVTNVTADGLGANDTNGNSTGITEAGLGSVVFNKEITNNARLKQVWPVWNTRFSTTEKNAINSAISLNQTFGLRYDTLNSKWEVVTTNNIPSSTKTNNAVTAWSLTNAGDTSGTNIDQSWIIRVDYTTIRRRFTARTMQYIFETAGSTKFYNSNESLKLDAVTGKPKRDNIKILKINNKSGTSIARLGTDYTFYFYGNFTEKDGHTDPKKVRLTMGNPDNGNLPDIPDAFTNIVSTDTIKLGTVTEDGYDYRRYLSSGADSVSGRTTLDFRYQHVATTDKRIDPASTNIIDLYVLTQSYHTNFVNWLFATNPVESDKPLQPSIDDLRRQFSSLDNKKSASDTIIYRPVKYKVLFGDFADASLKATFRVVKVPGASITDTEIRSTVINAINIYFDPNRWEFGETFYFTELSAYIHQTLAGTVASFVIVPQDTESVFGSLFQITCASDELFINGANTSQVEIVDNLSRSNLQSTTGSFINSSSNTGVSTGLYSSTSGGSGLSSGNSGSY
tara:strand:+ start:8184 stop:11756 length:3573 start_codon:yes stop_codon:yes gene_type:complete